jgi:ABC-2 type transport system ATP-binding protein
MREIREIIGRMAARGTTIFLSSHLLSEVERTCSHVAILRKGKVVRQGPVAELTGGRTVAVLAADDTQMLAAQVRAYPASVRVDLDGDRVRVQLKDADLAALNSWLAARTIVLSHLTLEQRSLEDAFMESTGASVAGMGVIE